MKNEVQVVGGTAKVGDHVQLYVHSYEWDKDSPIGPTNFPKPNGPRIKACGRIIEILDEAVVIESGMDRYSIPNETASKEVTLTEEHAS